MHFKRPPVPKFNDECSTPKRDSNLADEISHLVFKMDLDSSVEKLALKILNVLNLPNTYFHAKALIHFARKELQHQVEDQEPKVEYLSKCIEYQYSSLITTLCERMKMDQKATLVCKTLLNQMQPLINKLPKQLQNALAVKIATDIIYLKQGGINIQIIATLAKVKVEQLQSSVNRIKPFAFAIIKELFNYFNSHSL